MKKAAIALSFSALFTGAALAQTPASSASAPVAASAPKFTHEARIEARIKQLHSQLKITSAQESQWQTVADAMRQNAQSIDDAVQKRNGALDSMNAVDDLKSFGDVVQAQADGIKNLVSAFEPLYNSMSDAQKKTADEVFHPGRRRMPAGRHRAVAPKAASSSQS